MALVIDDRGYIYVYMGISKNSENNGKPYQNGWFGGTPIFGNSHIYIYTATWVMVYYRSHPLQEPEKSIHLDGILKKKQHSGFFNT